MKVIGLGEKLYTERFPVEATIYNTADEISLLLLVGASTPQRAIKKFSQTFKPHTAGLSFWIEIMYSNLLKGVMREELYISGMRYQYSIDPIGIGCYAIQLTFVHFIVPPISLK